MKQYFPLDTPEREFLHVVFLNLLAEPHLTSKANFWGTHQGNLNPLETFGFADIKEKIPTATDAAWVINRFRLAGVKSIYEGNLTRLLPTFKLDCWDAPKDDIKKYQNDNLVKKNIQMIRDYFYVRAKPAMINRN